MSSEARVNQPSQCAPCKQACSGWLTMFARLVLEVWQTTSPPQSGIDRLENRMVYSRWVPQYLVVEGEWSRSGRGFITPTSMICW